MSKTVSRRRFFAAVGGAVAAAAVAGGAWYGYQSLAPKPTGPLRWIGGAWAMYDDLKQKWKSDTGVEVESAFADLGTMISRYTATKGQDIDVFMHSITIGKPLIESSPPIFQPVDVDKIPRWKPGSVSPLFTDPAPLVGDLFASQILPYVWVKGAEGRRFVAVPFIYNFDTMGYNPEFVDRDVKSWGELFNREWKGRVAIIDVPPITVNYTALYLAKTGQMSPGVIDDLTPSEIDSVVDWLVAHKKAGQFRTFWADYGAGVNLHVSREVWLSDAWQPIAYDSRRAGVPMYYADPDEGNMFWINSESPSVATDKIETVYKWLDLRLSGWFANFIARVGYSTPTYPSAEVREAMGQEFYDWHFNGKRTYKPISETVPDKPERIAHALFVPEKYPWSKSPGQEHPQGNARDQGSIDRRIRRIGSIEIWLTNGSYYFTAWEKFKSA